MSWILILGVALVLLFVCRSGSNYSLRGKSVLVTGAASGLGSELAKHLSREGCRIHLWDVDMDRLRDLATHLDNPSSCFLYQVDVSDAEQVARAMKEFGYVDVVIANAGVANNKSIMDVSQVEIDYLFRVNLMQSFYLFKSIVPLWTSRLRSTPNSEAPVFVVISSVAGLLGLTGLTDYCSSKFALVAFSEGIRLEFRKLKAPIRTLVVLPFLMNTDMFRNVKLKFPVSLFLKVLDKREVAGEVVEALKKKRQWLVIPRLLQLAPLLLTLPISLRNLIYDVIGESSYIDMFRPS